jgi:hypothetical protein
MILTVKRILLDPRRTTKKKEDKDRTILSDKDDQHKLFPETLFVVGILHTNVSEASLLGVQLL